MKQINPGEYPMYLTEKVTAREFVKNTSDVSIEQRKVTLTHTDNIDVGDKIKYKNLDLNFTVIQVLESRPGKGRHPKPVIYHDLILRYER